MLPAPLKGSLSLPGDKSISHRSAMFSVIAEGTSLIKNISDGGDVASTIECLKKLGADYRFENGELIVEGKGLHSLRGKDLVLDCGNSGTSLRLLTGLLCGQDVQNISLIGDESLSKRPHNRVIDPLRQLGVDISGRDESFTPVVINSSKPKSGKIEMTVASAQVKSAILLAGLYADGPVTVVEIEKTRDHTENMLKSMGVEIQIKDSNNGREITLFPPLLPLRPLNAAIPGDPSSAAFFGVAAAIIPGSDIIINDLLLNPTRIAWIEALKSMGADIEIDFVADSMGEKTGSVRVKYSELNATDISENIAHLIDELPILALAMTKAKGISSVRNAKELRVKESDRISVVVDHLTRCGIEVYEHEDGYDVVGGNIGECEINSEGDHRIAMTFAIANYCSTGILPKIDQDVVSTSFPKFFTLFESLTNPSSIE